MENQALRENKPKVGRPRKLKGAGRPKNKYRSYKNAKFFVHKLKLDSFNEWLEFAKTEQRPHDIPMRPEKVYKDFVSMSDWIGKYDFVSFEEAKALIEPLNFTSIKDFDERYYDLFKRPFKVPKQPDKVYSTEWKGWKDFLQYEKADHYDINLLHGHRAFHHEQFRQRKFRPFIDAVKFATTLKLRDYHDYIGWLRSYEHGDMPFRPDLFYKDEWQGWKVFLGHDPLLALLDQSAVLYIAKHAQDPNNVYRIGINRLGKKDAILRLQANNMKVIRVYEHNNDVKHEVTQLIEQNCQSWYESPDAYIVPNIYDIMNMFFDIMPIAK